MSVSVVSVKMFGSGLTEFSLGGKVGTEFTHHFRVALSG